MRRDDHARMAETGRMPGVEIRSREVSTLDSPNTCLFMVPLLTIPQTANEKCSNARRGNQIAEFTMPGPPNRDCAKNIYVSDETNDTMISSKYANTKV